jgi:hypothetical protein
MLEILLHVTRRTAQDTRSVLFTFIGTNAAVDKISRTRPHVQDVWNISKYSLGSRLSASFPVFLPCQAGRLSHRRSLIDWSLHPRRSRTLPASSALTYPSSSSSHPRPSSKQRPSRQMPVQRGVVRNRPCRDPETSQHGSLSVCMGCAGLDVQSLPEVTRSRLLRGIDRVRCRRRGSGRTAFPKYPGERGFLYALASVFGHPLLCVSLAHCHTELIPASQHADQLAPISQGDHKLLFRSPMSAPLVQSSRRHFTNSLSVRSSSCAAVVNICGGSCGTGGGMPSVCCCWPICCGPGWPCGPASWRLRFSMCASML